MQVKVKVKVKPLTMGTLDAGRGWLSAPSVERLDPARLWRGNGLCVRLVSHRKPPTMQKNRGPKNKARLLAAIFLPT